MRVRRFGLFAAAMLLAAATVSAQEATIIGTVSDETKGALPGATVTATSLDNGRIFTDVSNERGDYRLRGLAPGRYKVQAELSGFAVVVVPMVEVLVGQNRTVPFAMQVASLQRDPHRHRRGATRGRQLHAGGGQRRPPADGGAAAAGPQLAGAGACRSRASPPTPSTTTPGVRDRAFQLNLDGQEITQQVAGSGFGQPQLQPRSDRRVPDHHQPVRHHPGPLARHPGAGDLALGHQRTERRRLRLLPRRQAERQGLHRQSRAALLQSADRRRRRRADRARTSCTTSCRTSARTSPTRS